MKLPPSMRVFERGWLSSNNILFDHPEGTVLVDSGYVTHAPRTLELLCQALGERALDRLVNTHCHSDHMGGNAAIQRRYGCRTSVPVGEAPLIRDWDESALILAGFDQHAERFGFDDTFGDGDTLRMGGMEWRVIAAPGHDTNAVMFHAPQERLLISGDALWENGFGVVFPRLFGRDSALAETRKTLETISQLDVRTVIPGHGRPFEEVGAALDRAFHRLESFESDIGRLARHALKVLLVFALLERRSLPLAGLEDYVASVPMYDVINRRFLGMSLAELTTWLVADLERAGALKRIDGNLVPTMVA